MNMYTNKSKAHVYALNKLQDPIRLSCRQSVCTITPSSRLSRLQLGRTTEVSVVKADLCIHTTKEIEYE
jgi:hypothetical protein